MDNTLIQQLRQWADEYEQEKYFIEDPIAFPKVFYRKMKDSEAVLQDIEIAGIIAAHLAWGRRSMIVRDCGRAFDEMEWKPYEYVMSGKWEKRMEDSASLHRTIRWSEFAEICRNLQKFYDSCNSLEVLDAGQIRTEIYGKKVDAKAADKKIHMMRRWFVRQGSAVDLGIWTESKASDLLIPLDVHTHRQATELGLTTRMGKDIKTVIEITRQLEEAFPGDPCRGDFALFGYGVTNTSR